MLHEHGLKLNTFFYFRLCAKFLLHYFFLISGIIVMMDIRECFVKTDVPIQHLEVNAVKDATAASSFVIIQVDVVLQVKKNVEIEMNKDIIFIGTRHRLQKFVSVGGGGVTFLPDIYMIFRPVTRKCM